MEELGGALTSGDGGARGLTRIDGSPASIEDIWSGLTSVEIDFASEAVIRGGGRELLARDRCQLIDIWSGSMSVPYFWV